MLRNRTLLFMLCTILVLIISSSCITINQPAAQTPTQAIPSNTGSSQPAKALVTTETAKMSAEPTPVSSPTPATSTEFPLPRIEAFVADPGYDPGGSKLSKLGDSKVAVDTAWQRLSNQTYYYTTTDLIDKYKPYDIDQLQKALEELKKTTWISLYKANYFDCSDMSALLQRELTIRGFESWIVIGKDPNVRGGHAWVVVFLRSPKIRLQPIEATALLIPQPGSTYYPGGIAQTYEDYSREGWVLQDIYQAIAWWSNEFDWWNKPDILQKLGLPTIVTTPTPPLPPTTPPSPKPNQCVLSTSVSPKEGGTVSPDGGAYDKGTTIFLMAIPSKGYRFANWSGSIPFNTSPAISFTMDTNKNITANFKRQYVLTTSANPQDGGTISPNGGAYDDGVTVTLKANPSPGYQFGSWTGDMARTNPEITVVMNSDKSITANFTKAPLTINFEGWYVGSNKVTTATKGQTVTAAITLSGGTAGQYTIAVRRDISWAYDETVTYTRFTHDGVSTKSQQSFVPPYASDVGSTNGYYVELWKDGNTLWSMSDNYPPRLLVSAPAPTPTVKPAITRVLPSSASRGQTFDVALTFSSPANNFNAIGLSDSAPAAWIVACNASWCSPVAMESRSNGNIAEYIWGGPYNQGSAFKTVYRVTVPANAATGTYSFSGTLQYYVGASVQTANIIGASSITVR